MPECHKCEMNGKRSRRCLTCEGPRGDTHHGQTFVSLDALDGYEADVPATADAQPATPMDQVRTAFGWVMRCWLQLDARDKRLVAERMLDPSKPIHATATKLRITTQAAHARLKALRESWPALRIVIPMKLLSDGKRRKAGERPYGNP